MNIGASNHAKSKRQENDYYATDPSAVEMLLNLEDIYTHVWEPACGGGHISKILEAHGYDVLSTDKYDYGYGKSGIDFFDFDKSGFSQFDYDIVTNPPYKYATEFIAQALNLVKDGRKVIMLLKLQFLEGKKRRELFKRYPPKRIWVSSSRILCAKDGDFETAIANGGSSMAYAWFVWEKGFEGDPTLKWFN